MRARRVGTIEDPIREYDNIDDFISSGVTPAGRFAVGYKGVPVDFLYAPVHGARTTVVFFHGSTKKTVSLPMHAGTGIMRDVPANRLAISDPSLVLDDSHELILSWFIGSSTQPRLQWFIERVVRRIKEVTGVQHWIFMGSSGGGFASMEMSRRFANSIAFAMNPQTNLPKYYANLVRQYLDLCWDGLPSLEELPGHIHVNLADGYSPVLNNTVAYVQNTRDEHHVTRHQLPFLEKVGASSNVHTLMEPWGDPRGKGHVPAPRELVKEILQGLVQVEGQWHKALNGLGFLTAPEPKTIEALVESKNANLPQKREVDVM